MTNDLTQQLITQSTSALKNSNVYVDESANFNDGDKLSSLYNGSHVGIVVTSYDTMTVYQPNTIASQILQNNPQFNTIVVVAYRGAASYGASGQNATKILEKINSNGGENASLALTQNSDYIKNAANKTQASTQVHHSTGSNHTPIIAGGAIGGVVILGLIAAIIAKKLGGHGKPSPMEQTHEQAPRTLPLTETQKMKESIRKWQALNRSKTSDIFNLNQIIETSKDLIDHWDEIDNTQAKNETKLIINEEIPKILNLYYALPSDYQHKRNSNGVSPHDTVIEQMKILEDSLNETRRALFDGKIQELDIQSVFVKDKYRKNINNLTLD